MLSVAWNELRYSVNELFLFFQRNAKFKLLKLFNWVYVSEGISLGAFTNVF